MYQTLTNIQTEKTTPLLQPIDNRSGKLMIGMRSISYTVGWYNLQNKESFGCRKGEEVKSIYFSPGLWSFRQIQGLVESQKGEVDISLQADDKTGLISLRIGHGWRIFITSGLCDILGLPNELKNRWLNEGFHTGHQPISLAGVRSLQIHLEQLNSQGNYVDGVQSNMLATVGVLQHAFGDIRTVRFEQPHFKRLVSGTISELKVTVKDDIGQMFDNHKLPISVDLEIK